MGEEVEGVEAVLKGMVEGDEAHPSGWCGSTNGL